MNVVEMISDLGHRGIELWLDDGRLRFRAPRGALDAEARQALVAHKPAIIDWLAERDAVRAGRQTRVPASPGQAGLLLDWQLAPESNHAHIATVATLRPDVDLPTLRAAARWVLDRHLALRTTWPEVDGEAVRGRLEATPTLDFSVIDARECSAAEVEARRAREMDRPFDLRRGPVTRFAALIVDDADGGVAHELVWTAHHIATDFFSQALLRARLDGAYAALLEGRAPPEPPPEALTPHDFNRWTTDLIAERGEALAAHWRALLADGLPDLRWPGPAAPPPAGAPPGDAFDVALDPALVRSLRALARAHRTTLAPVLLAGWQLLISRYVGIDRFMVLTPVALRDLPGLRETVGYLVNPVIIPAAPGDAPTFAALLDGVNARWREALEHRHHPFRAALRDLLAEGTLDALHRLPEFVYVNRRRPEPVDGLFRAVADTQRGAQSSVGLTVIEEGDGLRIRLGWRSDSFDRPAIERLAGHLATLLAGAVDGPERPIDDIEMLSPVERHQILVEWNHTARPYPRETPLHRLFEQVVERCPDAVALVADPGDAPTGHGPPRTLTYRALDARANRLARALRAEGVTAGAPVALYLDRSLDLIVAMLAVLEAGGAYVPLSTQDPPARLRATLADVAPPVIVTAAADAGRLPATDARIVTLDDTPHDPDPGPLAVEVDPEGPAYILFTSGSTGRPKGCLTPHRAVARIARSPGALSITAADVVATLAAVTFDAASLEIWGCLLNGGRLVVPPPGALGPRALGRLVARQGVTVLVLTAAMVHLVADDVPPAFAGLRLLTSGGDVLSAPHAARLRRALPRCAIVNCYGPTEGTVITTAWSLPAELDPRRPVPIGRPIPNTRVYILDRAGHPAPVGVPGELCAAGDGLASGYLDRPALTAERFPPAPPGLGEPGPIYRTGDRARWLATGEIEFLGRVDDQVKIRGFRVEPGEVESALRRHPAVRECAVIVAAGADGGKLLRAYVAVEPDGMADGIANGMTDGMPDGIVDGMPDGIVDGMDDFHGVMTAHLRRLLAEYMLPAQIVRLDRLPLTPTGKVDRAALAARAPTSGPRATGQIPGSSAPRTPTEALLAGIWAAVLQAPVGRDTHFFRAGGHSLLAVRALGEVRARAGVELPLRAAFDHPTLADLAAALDRAKPDAIGGPAPIPEIARDGELPLLPTQRRLWFLDRLGLPPGVYTIPLLLRLGGALNVPRLEAALHTLVARHESLRTVFPDAEGRPALRIRPAPAGFALQRAEADAEALFADAIARDFDLAEGPLFWAILARQADDHHLLLLAWHHIIADGLSVDRMLHELGALYAGESLPPAVQCVDYAAWRAARTHEAALAPLLDGWHRALDGAPAVHRLPTDRPRPAVQRFVGGHHLFELPATLLEPLRALAAAHDATLYMALLAAFEVLLSRSGAGDDLVIGTPVAGRDHPDAASVVGLLVDMLPLRCVVHGDAPFTALLAATRDTLLDAHRHQDAPFDRIVDRLRPERAPGHTPIFQIVFDVPHDPAVALAGLDAEVVRDLEAPIAKFDLTLSLMPGHDRFDGRIEYDTDLFDGDTIARMADRLRVLLEGIAADATRPVGELPLMTEAERRRVLVEWNDTASGYDREATVSSLFAARVARRPDAVALVLDDGADGVREVTYAALDRRARSIAGRLRAAGLGRGDRVGLYAERGADAIAGMLGALRIGAAFVPLDPSLPPARLAMMLDDCRPAAVLVGEGGGLTSGPWVTLALHGMADGIADDSHAIADDAHAIGDAIADDSAYVMYTSGSTGRPKGVEVSHRNIARLVARPNYVTLGPAETLLQAAPLGFDASTFEIWGALLNGARLVVPAAGPLALDRFAGLIARHRVDTLWLTAGLFDLMVDGHLEGLRPVRQLLAGGDVLSPATVRRALDGLPSCRIINGYGPTEGTTFTCCHAIDRAPAGRVPIGRPISDTRVYILDGAGRPTPIGVPGELYIGGDGVARGYLNRPGMTAERFVTLDLPEVGPTRLYRTGDRARWLADGTVDFLGRLDDQIKLRGFRVEPGEIEAALADHPAVAAARVVPRPGPDGQRLVAYVVPAGAPASETALRDHLSARLPGHMVPAAFVRLDALPLTPNGKLDRAALPDPAAAPASSAAPSTDLERQIAAIWRAVLDAPAVGIDDGFFDIGGSSLTLLRVHSRLQTALGRPVAITDLFAHPTIAGLARHLEAPTDHGEARRLAEDRAARRRSRLSRHRSP